MKCIVFDRGNGVIGIGFKIQFGGIDQFAIAWPDCPPERMTEDFLASNGVKILGESELSPPMDPPSVPVVDPVDPIEPLVSAVPDPVDVGTTETAPATPAVQESIVSTGDLQVEPPVQTGSAIDLV